MIDVTGSRLYRGVLATGIAAVVVFFAVPAQSVWQAVAWLVPPVLAAGLLTRGASDLPVGWLRRPLRVLAAGQLAYVAVSIVWFLGSAGVGFERVFPSPVDGAYLAVYGAYAVFVIALLRRSLGTRRIEKRIAVIDSMVVTASASAVLWVVVIDPQLSASASGWATIVALLYPAICLLLFALAVLMSLSAGHANVTTALLLWVWLGAATVGGVGYGVQSSQGEFSHGQPLMVTWMLSNTALAGLAAYPRMGGILHRRAGLASRRRLQPRFSPGTTRNVRLGVVLVASLVPLILGKFHGQDGGLGVLLLLSAAMFCLVTYRTALVAGDLDEQNRLTAQLDQAVGTLQRQRDDLARSAAIVDSTDDSIITISPAGLIVDWNNGAERMYGYPREEAVGRHISMLAGPRDAAAFGTTAGQVAEHGHVFLEIDQVRKDGTTLQTSVTASAIYDEAGTVTAIVGISRDISDRRAREAERHQDSKLESLGRLSAGLAHEINTPIQFVGDNTRFLAEAYQDLIGAVHFYRGLLSSDEPLSWQERLQRMHEADAALELEYLQKEIPSAVEQTLDGIDRVSTIVRAMKTFSHPGHTEQVPADLNEALNATLTVTRYQLKNVADLVLRLGDLPPVVCNIADLNQVFLNLIVNAVDAIEETGRRGKVFVSTSVEGRQAVTLITDTGNGIPDHMRDKIFEPFFTTKEVGRGSGQGLPLARAVVHEGHGGTLSVESAEGRGTTFIIRLPIAGRAPTPTVSAGDRNAEPVGI